ncbi:MAG TPA: hypothetical protein VFE50_22265 [Cyclobacteriaceae bacterium]|nr:hypothetical protein [Cyclobacteriaceae bacterium]
MALRACIVLIFLLISASAYSQLEGGYINKVEGYYFSKDGDFSWFSTRSKVRAIGRGKYTVKNDSIILNFGEAQREFDLQGQVPSSHGLSHSVIVVNAMRSPGGNPFAGLKFALEKSKVAGETDGNGKAQVTVENPPATDNIHFELDGYRTVDMPVQLIGKDIFFAVVVDETIRYVENVVLKLKFRRSGAKVRLNDTVFKKVSKRKFLDKSLS